jgi:hypothetical protein
VVSVGKILPGAVYNPACVTEPVCGGLTTAQLVVVAIPAGQVMFAANCCCWFARSDMFVVGVTPTEHCGDNVIVDVAVFTTLPPGTASGTVSEAVTVAVEVAAIDAGAVYVSVNGSVDVAAALNVPAPATVKFTTFPGFRFPVTVNVTVWLANSVAVAGPIASVFGGSRFTVAVAMCVPSPVTASAGNAAWIVAVVAAPITPGPVYNPLFGSIDPGPLITDQAADLPVPFCMFAVNCCVWLAYSVAVAGEIWIDAGANRITVTVWFGAGTVTPGTPTRVAWIVTTVCALTAVAGGEYTVNADGPGVDSVPGPLRIDQITFEFPFVGFATVAISCTLQPTALTWQFPGPGTRVVTVGVNWICSPMSCSSMFTTTTRGEFHARAAVNTNSAE